MQFVMRENPFVKKKSMVVKTKNGENTVMGSAFNWNAHKDVYTVYLKMDV